MSNAAYSHHLALVTNMGRYEANELLSQSEDFADAPRLAYENICHGFGIVPLSETPSTGALSVDRRSLVQNHPEELVEAIQRTIEKLKTGEEFNLQDLYEENKLSDIALYQAFEILIAHEAAEGISPYDCDEMGDPIHAGHKTMILTPGPELEKIQTVCIAHIKSGPPKADHYLTPRWENPRAGTIALLSTKTDPEEVADHAFRALNDPAMHDHRTTIGFRGPSMSVNDAVTVYSLDKGIAPQEVLCAPLGWILKENEPPKKAASKAKPVDEPGMGM